MTELGAPERRLSRRPWWIAALIGFPLAGLTGMFDAGYFLPRHLAGTFAAGVLTALLIVCTVTDLAGKKIFNWATYSAWLWAVMVNTGASIATLATDQSLEFPPDESVAPTLLQRLGAVGFPGCMIGSFACFFALLIVYQLSGFRGAGDVKLAAASGTWLGIQNGLMAILYTYSVAGVVLACWLIARVGPVKIFGGLARRVGASLLPGLVMPPTEDHLQLMRRPVPMAAFFAAGAGLAISEVLNR